MRHPSPTGLRSRRGPWRLARSTFAVLAAAALAWTGSTASAQPGAAAAGLVGPAVPVAEELAQQVAEADAGEPVRALLMLPDVADLDGARAEVIATLRDHADQTQAEVELALEQRADTHAVTVLSRFWITNMMLVEFPASSQTLDALSTLPGVRELVPNFELTAPEPVTGVGPADIGPADLTWGLDKIEAARVWDELGVDGSGALVATLDTGVDITHPDLAGKMVTDNPADPTYPGGWMEFDSAGNLVSSQPRSSASDHGTHVSGTIQGGSTSGTSIGVAPGADMMHGMVIPGGGGSFAQVAAGMQWAIAPTDADGNPAGRAADVVNMSLGGNGFQAVMIAPTRAMRAAGTFPAFAIGNNCGTVGTASPGNVYEAVAVGATDTDDSVASFSCGGVVQKSQWSDPPAEWPDSYVKPNISAPGVNTYSSLPGGGYGNKSGTSMATPHTAGTVALMLSAAGDLSIDETFDVLADTAYWDDRYADQPPDTRYGSGRINAYEATRFVALDSGITGTVTNAATDDPVADATVTVSPGGRQLTSGADGGFSTRVEPGTYSLEVSAFGYQTATVSGVEVTAEQFTTADVELTPLPAGSITGTATLDESGHGIPGVAVSVLDVPANLSGTTGTDGSYTIAGVPEGTYQVAASHPRFQASEPVEVTVVAGQSAQADFSFSPPPDTVAVVDSSLSRAGQYRDVVFTPRGVATEVYTWAQLDQAAQHKTVVLGYGLSGNYNADQFQAFLDATDASGAGVIFTDHAFGDYSGIGQLSRHTGQPASIGINSGGSDSAESYYEVTAEHPMLAGYQVGDRIVIDNSTQAKWVAWFDGYEGDGRQIIGNLGRTADGIMGGGVGVDQRANNRHVLLSTHGVSATRGPGDWTPEATGLFLNAIAWASPPPEPNQAYFALHSFDVGADVVKAGESVTVSVAIKNVGGSTGSHNVVLSVNGTADQTTAVNLAAGASRTVSWALTKRDLGTYQVAVEHMSGSFRVRAPIVQLAASTVDAPQAAAVGPLAGADVELLADGQRTTLGSTDADGRIAFEIPDPVGRYTVVIRKAAAGGAPAYLLHRQITVIDDDQVSFAPRVLARSQAAPAAVGEDFVVRADLALARTDQRHDASVFVRPAGTAPYGYQFQPGTLIATLDQYEAVAVHEVSHLEQDWWLPSRIVDDIDWTEPYDVRFRFGGAAVAELAGTVADNGEVTVDWDVTDAHGNPFATVLATDIRPFVSLPAAVALENIEGLLRSAVPNEQKPVLRLFDPDGEPVRAGSINWDAQPYTFTLGPDAPAGQYRLVLEVPTGGYSGTVSDQVRVQVGTEPTAEVELSSDRPDSVEQGVETVYQVRAVNSGGADSDPLAWTVLLAPVSGQALRPADVQLRVDAGSGWQRVPLRGDRAGELVGRVSAEFVLAAGAERTWRVSLLIRDAAGEYTLVDTLSGGAAEVASTGQLTVTAPAPAASPSEPAESADPAESEPAGVEEVLEPVS